MVLTLLSLLIGYLVINISTALLYAAWISSANNTIAFQFLAIASICGLGFATLGGWLTALMARKALFARAIALSLILVITWSLYTFIGDRKEPQLIPLLNLSIDLAGVITGSWIRFAQIKAINHKQELSKL